MRPFTATLAKGERLARYEVNAVIDGAVQFRCVAPNKRVRLLLNGVHWQGALGAKTLSAPSCQT